MGKPFCGVPLDALILNRMPQRSVPFGWHFTCFCCCVAATDND